MKKYLIVFLLIGLISCQEEPETDLTGRWHFNEPPQIASRFNRLDGSTPLFDVLFEVNKRELADSDLLLNGDQVNDSFSSVDRGETVDFNFQYQDFNLKLKGCKRIGEMMFVGTVEYTLTSGEIKVYKGLSVAQWWD